MNKNLSRPGRPVRSDRDRWSATELGPFITAEVRLTAAQTVATGQSATHTVTWSSARDDFWTFWNGGQKLIVPRGLEGLYIIDGNALWATSNSGSRIHEIRLLRGGVTSILDRSTGIADDLTSANQGLPVFRRFYLQEADEIFLNVGQNTGGNLDLAATQEMTRLSLVRLGPHLAGRSKV